MISSLLLQNLCMEEVQMWQSSRLANLIVRILDSVPSTCIFILDKIVHTHSLAAFECGTTESSVCETKRERWKSNICQLGKFLLAIDMRNIAACENCVIGVVDAGVEQSPCVE